MKAAEDPETFAEFFERDRQRLAAAVALSLGETNLATAAVRAGLQRTAQRWSRLNGADPLAHSLGAAMAWADRHGDRFAARNISTSVFDPADDLERRIGELPVSQRSALVCREWLGWDSERTAGAFDRTAPSIDLRHRRALGALRTEPHHEVPEGELIHATLEGVASGAVVSGLNADDDARSLIGSARRRTLRDRALIGLASLLVIALIGGLISSRPGDDDGADVEVATVDPPNASQPPHAPIADGNGGFVALALGGGQLSASQDGVEWLPISRFNVQRRDLRLSVERFFRSDGRYVAIVDSSSGGGSSVNGSDQPLVATSRSLDSWTLIPIQLAAFDDLPDNIGLRPRINLLNAAVAGNHVLAVVDIDQRVDFQQQRIRSRDVCTVANDRDGVALHRCDGEVIVVADQAAGSSADDDQPRLLRSTDGEAFVELPIDADFNPYGLFSFGGRFAMIDEATSQLRWSNDGQDWQPLFATGVDNRLGLVAGSADQALAISPSDTGWTSHLLQDDQVVTGSLPIEVDPTTIWLKPEIVHGPAGWAVFVTASRPWERGAPEDELGWAVYAGDLIIEQRSSDGSVRLRSTDGSVDYEYRGPVAGSSPGIERSLFGGVRLYRPGTSELVIEVSGDEIRESWVTGSARDAAASGVISTQGHTVEGNIRTGPIRITRPDGSTSAWADGFALTNGDISDGVEADPPWSAIDEPTLRFYDDAGALELVVSMFEANEALDPDVTAGGVNEPATTKALVAYSPDGVSWDVVWETTRDTWYGSVAVGDDELLLSVSGIGSGPQRIELPDR